MGSARNNQTTLCPAAKRLVGRVKMDYRGPAFDQSGWLRWCESAARWKGCFFAPSDVLRLGRLLRVGTGGELLFRIERCFVDKLWPSFNILVPPKRSCRVGMLKWGSICWERMKLGEEPLGPKIFVEMDFWRFPNESCADRREWRRDTRLMIVKHPLMGLRLEMPAGVNT